MCGFNLNDGVCLSCNPTYNSFDYSSNFFDPLPQYSTYFCNNCGSNHYDGFDCPSRVSFNYEPEPCNNQNLSDNYSPFDLQNDCQYNCCTKCGGSHDDSS